MVEMRGHVRDREAQIEKEFERVAARWASPGSRCVIGRSHAPRPSREWGISLLTGGRLPREPGLFHAGDISLASNRGRVVHAHISNVFQDIVAYRSGVEFVEPPDHVSQATAGFLDAIEAKRRE